MCLAQILPNGVIWPAKWFITRQSTMPARITIAPLGNYIIIDGLGMMGAVPLLCISRAKCKTNLLAK